MANTPTGSGSRAARSGLITYLEPALWRQLSEAASENEFCFAWLQLQCRMIEDTVCGVVHLKNEESAALAPAGFWPPGQQSYRHLSGVIEQALREEKGVVLRSDSGAEADLPPEELRFHLAFPVRYKETAYGVAALEIEGRPPAQLQSAMRQLQWGIAWLEKWVLQSRAAGEDMVRKRLSTALEITGLCLGEKRFKAAATACCTELATRLGCDRVAIGFLVKGTTRIQALSHSAQFEKQMNLVRAIAAAMDEAIDQACLLRHPAPESGAPTILRAHEELAQRHNSRAILTIPFLDRDGHGYGGLTLERNTGGESGWDRETVALCDALAAFIGPILLDKKQNDRPLAGKIVDSGREQFGRLVGSGHLTYKLAAAGLLLLSLFFAVARGDYRVTAHTALEGSVQRAITAPFDGYLETAEVRAGDVVEQGALLARLNDRDLVLERSKWVSQQAQHQLEYRQAMGKGDTAQASILLEQVRQAESQLQLLDEQLARTVIAAPFAGLVVSGDLSQNLGAPLEKGQVLFELAPLDSYRVMLEVNETEISAVKPGQTGELVLSAMPAEPLSFTVKTVTPVSVAAEGRSFFRVEASLAASSDRLRPGMEGYGKILVDRRRLLWIWSHDLVTWLRLKAWEWLP